MFDGEFWLYAIPLMLVIVVAVGLRGGKKTKAAPVKFDDAFEKPDKKGPDVEYIGRGWVLVDFGRKGYERMSIETAERAGYIKKKAAKKDKLKSAFGVPLE